MKVLIIRFSSIGDIVLTTPVIRALKQQLGAEVHFLTKANFETVLAANPYIDQLITIKKDVKEVLSYLEEASYDVVIDLHKNLRSLQVKRALKAKVYAFDKINWQKWLVVNFKINRLPDIHIVDRYLDTGLPLGLKNDGEGLDYFIAPEDEVDLNDFFEDYPLNEAGNTPKYVAFVIGAAHATKRLPPTRIIEICKKITWPVVLLGGPDEHDVGQYIAVESGEHVINSCGKLRLNQSASMVRQAHKVITHDTGLMHIAAAFRKDIISVWGNTIPEFGMYPYLPEGEGSSTIFEVKGLSCRPCSKIGYEQCPKRHFKCMNQIAAEAVAEAAQKESQPES